MKTFQKSSIHLLLLLFVGCLLSCTDDRIEFDTRPNKLSQPGGAIASSRIVHISEDTLTLELEVYIFNRFGVPFLDLLETDLTLQSNNALEFSLDGLDLKSGDEDVAYDAGILIDQSGSMSSNDPQNLRITAGKDFLSKLGAQDKVAVAAFSSRLNNGWNLLGNLTSDGTLYLDELDALSGKEGGGTPLFFSTFEMISYISQNGTNDRKAVIALTDGKNTDGGASLSSVISHAIDQGVRVYTVGLSRDVDFDILSDMAATTGGAFMWAAEAPQLLAMFGTLGRLLEGSADTFISTWQVSSPTGSFRSGQRVSGSILVTMPSGFQFEIPFSVAIP
ncbi:MAG: vWA domain-containing protein [Bacteroidota bacterium]